MNIERTNQDGKLVIRPEGRLDSLTAGELETAISEELEKPVGTLTLDMKDVDFISSKGLRVLVAAYKKLEGKEMILENANNTVKEVLKLSGLLKIFTVR